MTRNLACLLLLTSTLTLSSCTGGGGGDASDNSTALEAPANLAYAAGSGYYLLDVPVFENTPTWDGVVEEFSIEPTLPEGMELDPATGVIGGSPENLQQPRAYTITATGPDGSDTTELSIAVVEPPRFVLTSSPDEDSITSYVIDPETGVLRLRAVLTTSPEARRPAVLRAHPGGELAFTISEFGTITSYSLDQSSGRLAELGTIATAGAPHEAAITPSGEHLLVLSHSQARIVSYRIGADGGLEPAGSFDTEADPKSLRIDPRGQCAYVVQESSASVRTWDIDPLTGLLEQHPQDTQLPGRAPRAIELSHDGEWAFLTLSNPGEVLPARIASGTGALELLDAGHPTSKTPNSFVVHPTGSFLYGLSPTTGDVEVFSFNDKDGELSVSGITSLDSPPTSLTFDASGLFALLHLGDRSEVIAARVDLTTGELINRLVMPAIPGSSGLALTTGASPLRYRATNMYAVGEFSNDVQAWSLHPESGLPLQLGASIPTGTRPRCLAVDPLDRFVFVGGASSRTVHTYLIDQDGGLLDTGLAKTLGSEESPRDMAVGPQGRFLYLCVRGPDVLRSYEIDPVTGALSQVDEAPAGEDPRDLALHPTGRFLYSSDFLGDSIVAWQVKEGEFVGEPTSAAAPSRPGDIRFSAGGDRAFVSGTGSDILIPYRISAATGQLVPIPPGAGASNRPVVIEVHPVRPWAYAAMEETPSGNGSVRFLLVNEETGGLQGATGQSIQAGLGPSDLRIDPSGRFLYVLNEDGNDLSLYRIDPQDGTPRTELRFPAPIKPRALKIRVRLE